MPTQLYRSRNINSGAVFSIEKQFDDKYVIVPIDFAASLMDMAGKRTALEIQVVDGVPVNQVQQVLKQLTPACFRVLNSHEQQATLIQAIRIERLFVRVTIILLFFFEFVEFLWMVLQ